MRLLGSAAAGCVLLAVAAPVQAQDSRVVETIVESDLVALVAEDGYNLEEITSTDDTPSLVGKTEDGLLFEMRGTACDEEGGFHCHGIEVAVKYNAGDAMTAEKVIAGNLERAAIKVYWDRNNRIVGLTQYIILDGGVTWKNLLENLRITLEVQEAVRARMFD